MSFWSDPGGSISGTVNHISQVVANVQLPPAIAGVMHQFGITAVEAGVINLGKQALFTAQAALVKEQALIASLAATSQAELSHVSQVASANAAVLSAKLINYHYLPALHILSAGYAGVAKIVNNNLALIHDVIQHPILVLRPDLLAVHFATTFIPAFNAVGLGKPYEQVLGSFYYGSTLTGGVIQLGYGALVDNKLAQVLGITNVLQPVSAMIADLTWGATAMDAAMAVSSNPDFGVVASTDVYNAMVSTANIAQALGADSSVVNTIISEAGVAQTAIANGDISGATAAALIASTATQTAGGTVVNNAVSNFLKGLMPSWLPWALGGAAAIWLSSKTGQETNHADNVTSERLKAAAISA